MSSPVPQQAASTSEIDKAYDARHSVDGEVFAASMARYAALSATARETVPCRLNVCYDASSGQTLDLFADPGRRNQPVLLFIHGGYWRMLSKNESAFMAANLARFGVATAAIDYALIPDVTLETIVGQVRAALVWLYRNASQYGLDAARIVVSGSSAGGHLAAALLADDYREAAGLPAHAPCGALLLSGLYDMQPLRETFVNAWLQLDETRAAATSPIHMLPRAPVPVAIAWGQREPAGFKAQAAAYEARCRAQWPDAAPATVRAFEVPARHHFDVVLDLADPASAVTRAALDLLGVAAG